MAKPPPPPNHPLPPLPKMLLCVGGPLAGKMQPLNGHTLVAQELESPVNKLSDDVRIRRICYRVVMFQCGRDAYYMWTCLNDGDTLAELMNFYGTNKGRLEAGK